MHDSYFSDQTFPSPETEGLPVSRVSGELSERSSVKASTQRA